MERKGFNLIPKKLFHSQKNGDTKEMAEAVAEGLKDGGADIEMVNTNETIDSSRPTSDMVKAECCKIGKTLSDNVK